ncbi:tetratricopeptide repeat protein [Streptomyces caniscabiei]|uniref:tetratricopeptide repeat protein n=1 Tax=Streptomyces caniscabiei TaxID=2746961 RepID=UPI000AA74BC4|nr:tetratricopeptide repeat protein [Streptomyces caniscabiei]
MRDASAGDEASGGRSVEASGERAVAAGRDIRQVATGDFATQVQVEQGTVLPAEALTVGDVTWPVRYLPGRTGHFVGRERELALLEEAFEAPGGVVVHAVHGLGGVGKSTLAARWAAGRGADVNPVWWIAAESRAQLDAGLADLGRALTPALAGTLPEAALRERTLQWLSAHDGWLLVLDNVDDPADVRTLLDRAPRGRFLITTRRGPTSWRGIARTLDLDVLAPDEAVELFTTIYEGSTDGVEELCAELGCLPLAVDQAAAYCREAGITPGAYRELLARRPASLYASGPEGGDAERTVARVWRVTLDRLADTPKALMLLHILAWLGSDGVPRGYVELPGDPLEATEAIRRLAAHSMITLGDGTISVHRLVQAVTRTTDPGDPHRIEAHTVGGRRVAVQALFLAEPTWQEGDDTDMRALLRPEGRVWAAQVEAFAARYPQEEDTADTATLFTSAGLLLSINEPGPRAVALCERGLAAALRALDPDDEGVRFARGALAESCLMTGDVDRALDLRLRSLADCERLLGPDHPDTVRARSELSDALEEAEDRTRALGATFAHAPQARRILGADRRPDEKTPGAPNGTPSAQSPAEPERRQAWSLSGSTDDDPEDPLRLLDRARTASASGDRQRAVDLSARAVDLARRDLGDVSPVTLLVRAYHVVLLRRAGRHAHAEELAAGVNEDSLRSLGDSKIGRNVRRLAAAPAPDDAD